MTTELQERERERERESNGADESVCGEWEEGPEPQVVQDKRRFPLNKETVKNSFVLKQVCAGARLDASAHAGLSVTRC